ncbi:hypothetical protein SRB17_88400 [Streptomyces sp. RB17]|nr:hypothetical protein [Streptomyces sp. RB17]
MTSPDIPALRKAVAGAALTTPGVAGLHSGLAHRLAHAWTETTGRPSPPETGVRAEHAAGGSGWHIEVRCLLSEGHRALDVARSVRSGVRSAVLAHLTERSLVEPVTVTVTVTRIIASPTALQES